ncbi:MAG TPA: lysophospholipid acyltransferase family protein [Thermoanaerobaculia bacterium]|nr:lysophospholipid acyltransferase family protein [Thermoanaerobaculia bacterium]
MPTRRFLRAVWRGAALVAYTGACMLVWRAGAAWAAREPGRAWRWRCSWFRRWARGALRLLHIRLQVMGPIPQQPFLLVCNHLGYLDVPVLASVVDAAFVAKVEVASWPVLGRLCRWMGTLFVDRRRRRDLPAALHALDNELAAGRGVVVFPEGTSSGGGRVLPFHAPLLAAAAEAGLPVAWAALDYATPPGEPPASTAVCWWGDLPPFHAHFAALLTLPYVQARLRLGDRRVVATDRKRLADELHSAVTLGLQEGLEPERRRRAAPA